MRELRTADRLEAAEILNNWRLRQGAPAIIFRTVAHASASFRKRHRSESPLRLRHLLPLDADLPLGRDPQFAGAWPFAGPAEFTHAFSAAARPRHLQACKPHQ